MAQTQASADDASPSPTLTFVLFMAVAAAIITCVPPRYIRRLWLNLCSGVVLLAALVHCIVGRALDMDFRLSQVGKYYRNQ